MNETMKKPKILKKPKTRKVKTKIMFPNKGNEDNGSREKQLR